MTEHIVSELCVALSDEQQELVAGGADFELAGSNFANRIANLAGTATSGPDGSTANSTGQLTATNTAAQDLLGFGAEAVPDVEALGAAPVLNGGGGGAGGAEEG
ncbi:CTB family bacteriocin [Nodularia sphaerocarpa]|uniref:CTB family bacteriocin n=1 Tax=Nodularia sphaerocarpa TaxID=137816 RepID=UPI001EFAECE9|nr:CTB family bacteriocin [Nodularia sphaerocarpa]MDB9373099.1 CTB family bacteriocin [Nodularia sphaerocarpa CS-585]MDB9376871.1 CTB family bacteriocin [Nodularia sphaerocarpa CS-585A2]ULP73229.1 hypothetical protein BDGGKGIB_02882 [Nodularia sphaerocarpa UHCC 0038]